MTREELLNGFLDGLLGEAELAELSKALDADPEFRKDFARAVDQHGALGDLLAKRARPSRRWVVVAAAAAVLLGLVGYALFRPAAPVTKQTVPFVTAPKPEPPKPEPPKPEPRPEPRPEPAPKPEPKPEPKPQPEPEPKPEPKPQPEPEPKPEPKPAPKPEPKPEPPRETRVAVATLESLKGEVHTVSEKGQKAARAAQALFDGEGLETGAAGTAVIVFADATRVELRPSTTLNGISAKRVSMMVGGLVADVKTPMVFATRTAEAAVLGTRLALTAGERVKLEVREGKVRFTHEKRTVEVGAGQTSIAAKGVALTPKRTTRGAMMAAPAIWGEDFEEPEEVEKDWRRSGTGLTYDGPLAFDLGAGDGAVTSERGFEGPFKAAVDVEFTHRLQGTRLALRLGAWKGGGIVHCDMDEEFYYLTVDEQVVTVANTRKAPRRERWAVELRPDATVFLVDGREILRARKASPSEFHLTLLAKAKAAPAGARARFDNLVVERLK